MAVSSLTGMVSTAQLSAFSPGLKAARADALVRSDPQGEAPRLGTLQIRDQVCNTRFGQITNLNVATSSDQEVLTAAAASTAVETTNLIHVTELALVKSAALVKL